MKLFKRIKQMFHRKEVITDIESGIIEVSLDALMREYEREIMTGRTDAPFIRWVNNRIHRHLGVRFNTNEIMNEQEAA